MCTNRQVVGGGHVLDSSRYHHLVLVLTRLLVLTRNCGCLSNFNRFVLKKRNSKIKQCT